MAWKKVGSIRKSKKGNLYIKFDSDVTMTKDSVLQIQNPRDKVQALMKSGKLSEQEGNERLAKIHEYIRQEIYLVDDNGE
jgi:hypothetical protein